MSRDIWSPLRSRLARRKTLEDLEKAAANAMSRTHHWTVEWLELATRRAELLRAKLFPEETPKI